MKTGPGYKYTARSPNYPWTRWLNSGSDTVILSRGRDFTAYAHLFRQNCTIWANAHGYRVKTEVHEDDVIVRVVSRPPDAPKPAGLTQSEEASLWD